MEDKSNMNTADSSAPSANFSDDRGQKLEDRADKVSESKVYENKVDSKPADISEEVEKSTDIEKDKQEEQKSVESKPKAEKEITSPSIEKKEGKEVSEEEAAIKERKKAERRARREQRRREREAAESQKRASSEDEQISGSNVSPTSDEDEAAIKERKKAERRARREQRRREREAAESQKRASSEDEQISGSNVSPTSDEDEAAIKERKKAERRARREQRRREREEKEKKKSEEVAGKPEEKTETAKRIKEEKTDKSEEIPEEDKSKAEETGEVEKEIPVQENMLKKVCLSPVRFMRKNADIFFIILSFAIGSLLIYVVLAEKEGQVSKKLSSNVIANMMKIFGETPEKDKNLIAQTKLKQTIDMLRKELEEAKTGNKENNTLNNPEKTIIEPIIEEKPANEKIISVDKPVVVKKKIVSKPKSTTENMVLVPSGEFIFGSKKESKKVTIKSFYIDIYEVSNAEYRKFNPRHQFPEGEDNFPATGISFFDAKSYAEWLGKRLPTEEEWEKAARGTDGRIYPWGNEFDPKKANTMESKNFTMKEISSYKNGKSPYGCLNMCGNVWEWTSTIEDNNEDKHVLKGGSNLNPGRLSTTFIRELEDNLSNYSSVGFRCAKDNTQVKEKKK